MLRLLAAIGFAALSLWSAILLGQDLDTADQQFIARRIEGGFSVSAANVTEVVARIDDSGRPGLYCRSDVLFSELTLRMAQLDMQDSTLDYENWQIAMDGAQRFLQRAIACSPASANIWIRLAMVSLTIAEEPKKLAAYLAMSAKLGRAERPTLEARVAIWKRASEATLALSADLVVSDFFTLLRDIPMSDVRALVSGVPEDLKQYVFSAIQAASVDRPEILRPATTWLEETADS